MITTNILIYNVRFLAKMALVDQPLLIYLLSLFKELQHFVVDPQVVFFIWKISLTDSDEWNFT